MRVTVLGAGVAGLCCALELAERGVEVEVIDRGERLGAAACSWYAGGMLAPWCECADADARVAQLGAESIGWWRERVPGTILRGSLVVAHGRDAGELAHFGRRTQQYAWLDAAAIGALEPALAGRFQRGLHFPGEAHLDPRVALATVVERLRVLGVVVRFGGDRSSGAGGLGRPGAQVIDCTGLAARDALPDLRGVKGEMLLLRQPEIALSRPVRILHPRIPVYLVPRGEGLFMVGATMIESDQPGRISARSMLELLSAACAVHPAFGEAGIVETGTGVRPAFADNLPRIRRVGGTLYVNGLYRHGFLLAPALARRVAGIVLQSAHFPEVQDGDPGQRRLA